MNKICVRCGKPWGHIDYDPGCFCDDCTGNKQKADLQERERRLEKIRRSCLNCGHQHYNADPCCQNPLCVSDLIRTVSATADLRLYETPKGQKGLMVRDRLKGFNIVKKAREQMGIIKGK